MHYKYEQVARIKYNEKKEDTCLTQVGCIVVVWRVSVVLLPFSYRRRATTITFIVATANANHKDADCYANDDTPQGSIEES